MYFQCKALIVLSKRIKKGECLRNPSRIKVLNKVQFNICCITLEIVRKLHQIVNL
jgi:hypothetical protein